MHKRTFFTALFVIACAVTLLVHAQQASANEAQRGGASIEGTVWLDSNQDGLANEDELRQANALIVIATPEGELVDYVRSDATGGFAFASLAPGEYMLYETDMPGTVSTTPNLLRLELTSGQVATVSFGDTQSLTGCFHHAVGSVWHDANSDGLRDSQESCLALVVVQAWTLDGSLCGITLTDDSGAFALRNLAAEPCYVVAQLPAEMDRSSTPLHWGIDPSSCYPTEIEIGVCADGDVSSGELSEQRTTPGHTNPGDSQVSGAVWLEGTPSSGGNMAPIEGVKLVLSDTAGNTLAECRTDKLGHYCFEDLAWGSYYLRQSPVAGTNPVPSCFWGVATTVGSNVQIDLVNRMNLGAQMGVVSLPLVASSAHDTHDVFAYH